MQTRPVQPSRRRMLGLAGAALLLPRTAIAAPLATLSGDAFGTTWRLIAPAGAELASLRPAIDTLFAGIDRRFSPWRPDSTLARFNAMRSGQPLADTDLARVTAAALTIAERSGGAFDPSVGPLVAQWGFGPIRSGGAPDWRGLQASLHSISKTRDDLTLDLCGIAKGWALDRAGDLVTAAGIDSFLMEIGGEFTARGRHPDARDWRLAIDTPPAFAVQSPLLWLPSGASVATSGLWEQSYSVGKRL